MFLAPNIGTLVVQVINFIIFLMVMNVIFFRPVSKAIAARRAYIETLSTDYESALTQARELRRQADERRATARREADELIAAARARANVEAERIGSQYGETASASVAKAHEIVGAEETAAQSRRDELARQLASVILQRTLIMEQVV